MTLSRSVSPTSSSGATNTNMMFDLWVDRAPRSGLQQERFETCMRKLATFDSLSSFQRAWKNAFPKPIVAHYTNIRIFKHGISPLWEDAANESGGKWLASFPSGTGQAKFLDVVASFIAADVPLWEQLNGVVLCVRPEVDSIAFWNNECAMPSLRSSSNTLKEWSNAERIKYRTHKATLKRNATLSKKQDAWAASTNMELPFRHKFLREQSQTASTSSSSSSSSPSTSPAMSAKSCPSKSPASLQLSTSAPTSGNARRNRRGRTRKETDALSDVSCETASTVDAGEDAAPSSPTPSYILFGEIATPLCLS